MGGIALLKKILALFLGYSVIYLGVCLAIKAHVGLAAYDALCLTLSRALPGTVFTVGTVAILMNSSFVLGQIALERKSFRPIELSQFLFVFFGGRILDFFVYTLFGDLVVDFYPWRLGMIVLALATSAFGVMIVMEARFVRVPLEGFCQLLAERLGTRLGIVRQIGDVVFCVVALGVTFVFQLDISVREGTVLCVFIFGPLLDAFRRPIHRLMEMGKI